MMDQKIYGEIIKHPEEKELNELQCIRFSLKFIFLMILIQMLYNSFLVSVYNFLITIEEIDLISTAKVQQK